MELSIPVGSSFPSDITSNMLLFVHLILIWLYCSPEDQNQLIVALDVESLVRVSKTVSVEKNYIQSTENLMCSIKFMLL